MMRRYVSIAAAVLGLAAAPAPAQKSTTPEQAPAEWVAYAGMVNAKITGWMESEDPVAKRLHAFLDAHPAPIALKVWLTKRGRIARVEFASLGDAQADADLRALIVGKPVDGGPPKGMLQPLRLRLEVKPAPAETGVTG